MSTVAATNSDKIAVDDRWVYTNSILGIIKLEKTTKTYNHRFLIQVPGHNTPTVEINSSEGTPGETVVFPVKITNKNQNSPEYSMNFYIKSISLDNHLSRSFEDVRCYNDEKYIANNISGIIYFCLNSSGVEFNKAYRFSAVIGTIDQQMDVSISADYIVRTPGPPIIRIVGDKISNITFNENQAAIAKGEDAWYTIQIANTENTTNDFGFLVSGINYETYDKFREVQISNISLGYRSYDRKDAIAIKLSTSKLDYSSKDFTIRIYNILHPSIYKDAILGIVVTPCNYNNICNIENGENHTNCGDCLSDIKCLYGDSCHKTTSTGVEFGADMPSVDKFVVCRRGVSEYSCLRENERACPGSIDTKSCFCSLNNTFGVSKCSIECADSSQYYYLL